jgi:hypothetical protein
MEGDGRETFHRRTLFPCPYDFPLDDYPSYIQILVIKNAIISYNEI